MTQPTSNDGSDQATKIEWARQAKNLRDSVIAGRKQRPLTKDMLMSLGASFWSKSYALTDDDREAFNKLIKHFTSTGDNFSLIAAGAPDIQILFSWAARWADQAFPHIVLGHKIAAALMATSANEEILQDVRAPWKAYLITIPPGLIELLDESSNKFVSMTQLGVQTRYREEKFVWNWWLSSADTDVQLWRFGVEAKDLVKADLKFNIAEMDELFGGELTDKDERVAQLVGRLIIGISLSFPEHNKPIGPIHKQKPPKRGWTSDREGQPISRTYELRPPIKIDCRDIIRTYAQQGSSRKGSIPTVQTLVIGHWRRPPGGIEKGASKTVWVQPFFRGNPEDNIVVRAHKVIDK